MNFVINNKLVQDWNLVSLWREQFSLKIKQLLKKKKKVFHLFLRMLQVLVAACRIFSCDVWDF